MLEFITSNYNRSLWITRLTLVATIIFANIFFFDGYMATIALIIGTPIQVNFLYCIAFGVVFTAIAELGISLAVKIVTNLGKIYSLPIKELSLFAMISFCLYSFILGAFNCVYFFTPIFYLWGQLLFPVIASIPSWILFFAITNKLYLSPQVAPYVFKVMLIVFFVINGFSLLLSYTGVL